MYEPEKFLTRLEKYTLIQSCGACPEAYSVNIGDREVARLRLRHGHFTASIMGEVVYEASPRGDGIFEWDERDHHLHLAIKYLDPIVDPDCEYGRLDPDEPVPEDDPDICGAPM